MRALLLLAALLIASPAPAGEAPIDPLRIPDRFDLPGGLDPAYKVSPEVAKLDGKALLAILRDPKDARRPEAVLALTDNLNDPADEEKSYALKPLADLADAIDILLDLGEPLAFRRWAVYTLFTSGATDTRRRITRAPEDRRTQTWWRRFGAVRDRALKDADPRLAEFFERYREDPLAPKWEEAKKAAAKSRDRMLADHPERRENLAEVWRLQESVEKQQLDLLPSVTARIEAQSSASPGRIPALIAVERSVLNHRLRISWANMVPRIMAETYGESDAKSYGFVPAPVTIGWPEIPKRR